MKAENGGRGNATSFFKKYLVNNLGMKIAAVVFAMIIWGIVLTMQNQSRIKVINDVPVNFLYESDLHARELVIRGNPLEAFGSIAVRANVPILNYTNFSKDDISARIDLNRIMSPGILRVPINVTTINTRNGAVIDSASPGDIEIEIDRLMTKRVPVEAQYNESELPKGNYADFANMRISSTSIEIRGPQTDVSRVTKAVCKLQLAGREKSYNDAFALVLLDEKGEEVDSASFVGGIPSVTVTLPIYYKKTVPIDVRGSLLGADNLAANYELYTATATPEAIEIVGDASILDEIESLFVESIDITSARESKHLRLPLAKIPEGVKVSASNINIDEIEVFVGIREVASEREFQDIPIEADGLLKGLSATILPEVVDIRVQGRISLVELLERKDIRAFVDLNGMQKGTREDDLLVRVYIKDDETTLELMITIIEPVVSVAIE